MPLYIFGQGEFLNRALECISPRLGFKEYYPNQMLGVVVTGLILLQELRLAPSLEQLSKESSSSKICPKKRGNTVQCWAHATTIAAFWHRCKAPKVAISRLGAKYIADATI